MKDNLEKYEKAFEEAFGITREEMQDLKYQGIAAWDSVGHMELVSILEEYFDIMMEADDIIDFSSYEKGKEILRTKYNIEL